MARGDLLCRLAVMCSPNDYLGGLATVSSMESARSDAFLQASQPFPSLVLGGCVLQKNIEYE